MKKFLLVCVVIVLFLPLIAQAADGVNKPRKAGVNCNSRKLSAKARKACVAKAAARAAAIARRRAEEARRYELAQQAVERKFRDQTQANIAKDDTTGEDLRVRQIAINALGGKGGTVVVMDPKAGMIYTIVNQEWAIRKSYIPCSTIKLVTGAAGLQEEVIDEEGEIIDSTLTMDLDKAIAKSNNAYFDRVGAKVGREKFVQTAESFGLGHKTGINAEGENPGRLPFVKKTGRSAPRYYSFGEDTAVTPLQLAVMVSGFVNGGEKVKPTILKTSETVTPQPTAINIPKETLQGLIPGMQGATEFGTARRSGGSIYGVVGKTGTCSDSISRIGLYASSASVKDPKFTVVVVIRGRKRLNGMSYTNGPAAARIAGKIYQSLLGNSTIALNPVNSK
jgi:cell division protein FtsI/penicillin-binding protein 2